MLKRNKILKTLVESQIGINKILNKLNKNIEDIVKPKFETISISADKIMRLDQQIECNIYTKEQTVEQINKEYDYRQKYETYKKTNSDLLEMIEKYCRYDNKYKVLELFEEIERDYSIKKL